jgi:hypothetical protein
MICRYHKTCPSFNPSGACCQNDAMARNYYGVHRAVGCYRDMTRGGLDG